MRVDFYRLSRDPAGAVAALIARNTLRLGKRLLVVAEGTERLAALSEALWSRGDAFLANGLAGQEHDARQPVLLSEQTAPANGATFMALADGVWREAEGFERVFLIFDDVTVAAARDTWRQLGQREGVERHFWKQDGSRWIEAG
mgnify:CR=1 FL=1